MAARSRGAAERARRLRARTVVGAAAASLYACASTPAGATRFDFRRFDRMPGETGVELARREAARMFPTGSPVERAIDVLTASGASCQQGRDNIGPFVSCTRRTRQILLVSVDWRVVLYTDEAYRNIAHTFVGREATGP